MLPNIYSIQVFLSILLYYEPKLNVLSLSLLAVALYILNIYMYQCRKLSFLYHLGFLGACGTEFYYTNALLRNLGSEQRMRCLICILLYYKPQTERFKVC